jgi:hypothetical protein
MHSISNAKDCSPANLADGCANRATNDNASEHKASTYYTELPHRFTRHTITLHTGRSPRPCCAGALHWHWQFETETSSLQSVPGAHRGGWRFGGGGALSWQLTNNPFLQANSVVVPFSLGIWDCMPGFWRPLVSPSLDHNFRCLHQH